MDISTITIFAIAIGIATPLLPVAFGGGWVDASTAGSSLFRTFVRAVLSAVVIGRIFL